MKILLQNIKTGKTYIEEIPLPSIKSKRILVKTQYSAISIGTEMMIVELAKMNFIDKARKRPEDLKKVLLKIRQEGLFNTLQSVNRKLDTPMTLGYSASGIIEQVSEDISEFKVGDRVAIGGGGFVSHAEYNMVPPTIAVKVPDNVSLKHASFATIASIGINAMRITNIQPGEYVCIIGLGLIGLLTASILSASGCNVYGIEIDENRRKIASKMGVKKSFDNTDSMTIFDSANGRGFDKVLITASGNHSELFKIAGEIARDRADICLIGDLPIKIPRKIYYEKELKFYVSRAYGAGRYDVYYEDMAIDYPIGYVKWTEKRNMQFFIDLLDNGKIDIEPIISNIYDFYEADKVYKELYENRKHIGVLFKYAENVETNKIIFNKTFKKSKHIVAGIIGAGNFVQSTMLPILSEFEDIQLKGISDMSGKNASYLCKKYNFSYATSDYKTILNDKGINLIIIASPHSLHSTMIIEALESKKDVYCEKPPAITLEQLEQIKNIYTNSNNRLYIGYNRRFSPHISYIKDILDDIKHYNIIYEMNAGYLDKNHWLNSAQEGGRLIGEACHILDLFVFLNNSNIMELNINKVSSESNRYDFSSEASIVFTFENGNIATLIYTGLGNKNYPKESMRIYGSGKIIEMINYKHTRIIYENKIKHYKTSNIEKGFKESYKALIDSIINAKDSPIPFEHIYQIKYLLKKQ